MSLEKFPRLKNFLSLKTVTFEVDQMIFDVSCSVKIDSDFFSTFGVFFVDISEGFQPDNRQNPTIICEKLLPSIFQSS